MPRPIRKAKLHKGMKLDTKWKCDCVVREHAALIAVSSGIKVLKTKMIVDCTCCTKLCKEQASFSRQGSMGE